LDTFSFFLLLLLVEDKFSGQILSILGPKKMGKKQGNIFLLQIQFGRGVWGERERNIYIYKFIKLWISFKKNNNPEMKITS
jgi:hypothetical protein